ncbi:unnamed protein product [Notodromas monacha]|uniref:Inosine/uridine-preferring nucleoside hydrolase domain-containing protein n=1 Tax=Notodromas monacha TaxID=399045 RepID=A0A7R9BP42_9CRUS|nr:unnamed protein product [Notodromas monacha]CAG0919095.1 unnamed protein product [Notodromas monacha]
MNITCVLTSVLKRALSNTKWCRRPLPPTPRDARNVMKLIIDCDAGVDDAMALIMALDYVRKGKAQVLAVTCVQGNTGLDNVVVNVLRTMNAMDIQVPVYRGAKDPLIGPYIRHGPPFHGEDGLGDAHFDTTPDLSVVSSEHASLAIARLVRDNPDLCKEGVRNAFAYDGVVKLIGDVLDFTCASFNQIKVILLSGDVACVGAPSTDIELRGGRFQEGQPDLHHRSASNWKGLLPAKWKMWRTTEGMLIRAVV